MPSSLPLSAGMTVPIARAAPVEFGMIDSAAARIRRRSGLPERRRDRLVLELLVARVGVHRVDESLLDAEALVQTRVSSARDSWSCTTRSR